MSEPAPGDTGRGLVLVIEDERAIADLQRLYLTREGFGVRVEAEGRAGLDAARRLRPVAIVLDVRLPDMDGMDVCRELRADGDPTPIVFVTARDEEVDRILGLELGGDDYLTKPFSPRELVARVKAVLRRGRMPEPDVVAVGDVRLDPRRRRAYVGDTGVALTATEFDLLLCLFRNEGQVLSRDQLLSRIWGYAGMGSRTVDVHVAQVRAKIGAACPIRTVRGVGYVADAG
ncbi:MAG TPA: response regulator transcription factor [Streptosporangiaceae bacterium]|jgi:DNA-binding response OmpR family regulator